MASLRKNTAGQNLTFCLINSSTGAAVTSTTITVYLAKDGGSQLTSSGTITNLGNGQYNFAPTAGDTNATDVGFLFTGTGSAIPVNYDFHTDNWDTTQAIVTSGTSTDQLSVTSGKVDIGKINGSSVLTTVAQLGVNVLNWNNTAVSTPATAGIPDINVKNINNAAVNTASAQIGVNLVNILGSSVLTSVGQLGVNLVNISGSTVSTTTAQLGVNTVKYNNQTAVTDSNNYPSVNITDINGSSVLTNIAQLGVNLVSIKGAASAGAAGYVGHDWSAINAATTTTALTGTTIASVAGAVGSVTGSVGSVTNAVNITSNRKKAASTTFEFIMQSATTGAATAGLTGIASVISKDGGAFSATANTVTAIANGWYKLALTTTEMTADNVALQMTTTSAISTNLSVQTQP